MNHMTRQSYILDEDEVVLYRTRIHWLWNLRSFGLPNLFHQLLITDQRILRKSGIFNVRTESLVYSQIEAKDITQSILGRIFGYGDVVLNGAGGKLFVFKNLSDPAKVGREIGKAARLAHKTHNGVDGISVLAAS